MAAQKIATSALKEIHVLNQFGSSSDYFSNTMLGRSSQEMARDHTDDKMMSFAAPVGPLATEAIRLGAIAMIRVMMFRAQLFIFASRKP